MTLAVTAARAMITVANELPVAAAADAPEGRGMRGMRQRVELLGGRIDAGPSHGIWSVHADIPLGDANPERPGRFCTS